MQLRDMHLDYLGCADCDRLEAEGTCPVCNDMKDGCKRLLAMLDEA